MILHDLPDPFSIGKSLLYSTSDQYKTVLTESTRLLKSIQDVRTSSRAPHPSPRLGRFASLPGLERRRSSRVQERLGIASFVVANVSFSPEHQSAPVILANIFITRRVEAYRIQCLSQCISQLNRHHGTCSFCLCTEAEYRSL